MLLFCDWGARFKSSPLRLEYLVIFFLGRCYCCHRLEFFLLLLLVFFLLFEVVAEVVVDEQPVIFIIIFLLINFNRLFLNFRQLRNSSTFLVLVVVFSSEAIESQFILKVVESRLYLRIEGIRLGSTLYRSQLALIRLL